jgi:anthranilate synthase component 2
MSLLIIDNYDSFTYNLIQLVETNGIDDYILLKNDRLDSIGEDDFKKVVISPGPGVASEAGMLTAFIEKYHKSKSFLGVCLGFEALGEFFGAVLKQLEKPLHGYRNIGTVINNGGIFKDLPSTFHIGHYHSWYFDKNGFPENLIVDMVDEEGLIMAFHHKKYSLYGVQFHPESIMTDFGDKIIGNWLSL